MITGILDDMAEARFWDTWDSKFRLNSRRYIKPYLMEVEQAVENLNIAEGQSDSNIAKDVSDWIHRHHDYKLSKKWKRPDETLNSGVGDCEDYVFLLASMLPHYGITDFNIVVGDAVANGKSELHVWLEMDGEVIDPTASDLQAKRMEYRPEIKYGVSAEGY